MGLLIPCRTDRLSSYQPIILVWFDHFASSPPAAHTPARMPLTPSHAHRTPLSSMCTKRLPINRPQARESNGVMKFCRSIQGKVKPPPDPP
eukprot:648683-Pelagomonas_calceolata.AAC.1